MACSRQHRLLKIVCYCDFEWVAKPILQSRGQAAGADAVEPKQSRADLVYSALREAILEQALRPGTKLSEDVIAEQFAVSRTSVRAALQQLRGDGLIELQANKGASVSEPTAEDARDIFALRRMLEAEVVHRLAGQLNERDCGRLRAHVEQEKQAQSVGGPASIRLAGEFHILLAELTGSPSLTRFVREIVSRGSLILARFARDHSSECAVDEHERIIAALQAGDTSAAEELMLRHLEAVAVRADLQAPPTRGDTADILKRYAERRGLLASAGR
ncbi:GntR family transcriptional regulator [Mesorhizobium composti]|uniref:GntR family transcriptional regulator n=1 Tax=Ollibium composti TaxID=2675109 RepID=A0ABY2Q3Z7_9HYPH|nr:GntR family transcriptional regulator [Mesorhizobium composti]